MESNITDQQFWGSQSALSPPHFDEQATLLSARPVVPIARLSVRPVSSRMWLFGFALVGMLFLGIAATSLYYSQFTMAQSQPNPETDTASSGLQGFASAWVVPVEPPKETLATTRSGNPPVNSNRSDVAKTQQRSASSTTHSRNLSNERPVHRSAAVFIESRPDFEDEIRRERAARRELWEQKQDRRQRRSYRYSDRRYSDKRYSDRIRDIFEGPSRP